MILEVFSNLNDSMILRIIIKQEIPNQTNTGLGYIK